MIKVEEINKRPIWELLRPIEELAKQTKELRKPYEEELNYLEAKIREVSNQIKFVEGEHRYFYNDKECMPVSHLVEKFIPETDFDVVAQNYVAKNHLLIPWQRQKQIWNLKGTVATTTGTFIHQYGEDLTNICNGNFGEVQLKKWCYVDGYYFPINPKQIAIYKYFEYCLANKEIPFLAEIQLVLKDYAISGTFDKLVYSTVEKGLIMRDYKSNETLSKDFKKPMKAPFQLYNDEALSHYIIQQNAYSLMLKDRGINVLRKELVWVKENEEFMLIRLPDIEDLVLKAIKGLKLT